MKICLIGKYPPERGGISTHLRILKRGLEERGHEVTVVTYAGNSKEKNVISVPIPKYPFARGLSFTFSSIPLILKKHIDTEKFDLIHSHYLVPPGIVGGLSSKVLRVPSIVTAHGSDVYILSKSKAGRSMVRLSFELNDVAIGVSSNLVREMFKLGARNVKLIRHGVPKPEISDKRPREDLGIEGFTLSFVGNLVPQKGIKYLLEAIESMDGVNLMILGDGPEKRRILTKWRDLIGERVFILRDYLPGDVIDDSDALVLPSISESFGLVLLEAMSLSKPVLASKVGGIPEIVIDGVNGILFRPRDVHSIRKAINTLKMDENLRKRMGREGEKIWRSKYTPEEMLNNVLEVYLGLIEG